MLLLELCRLHAVTSGRRCCSAGMASARAHPTAQLGHFVLQTRPVQFGLPQVVHRCSLRTVKHERAGHMLCRTLMRG